MLEFSNAFEKLPQYFSIKVVFFVTSENLLCPLQISWVIAFNLSVPNLSCPIQEILKWCLVQGLVPGTLFFLYSLMSLIQKILNPLLTRAYDWSITEVKLIHRTEFQKGYHKDPRIVWSPITCPLISENHQCSWWLGLCFEIIVSILLLPSRTLVPFSLKQRRY